MSSRVLRIMIAVLLTCALLRANTVTAQEVASPVVKIVSFPAANNVNELYVSIMGEVERPGTYRLTPNTLKLHSVVRCAHGFTANASSAIRVIRRGRASQLEIFSDKIDSPVLPGDLLLVESRRINAPERNYSDVSAGRGHVTRADYSDTSRRPFVQIALLNVVEYPLVLRLHPEEANANYVVQALGQPVALLANAHVITPDVPRRQSSDAAKNAVQMQDGSIIVFEPGKIKRHRLPSLLPTPIDRETALASQFGMSRQARLARDLRQLEHDSFADEFDTLDPNRERFSDLLTSPDDALATEEDNSSDNPTNLASLTTDAEISEVIESPSDESADWMDESEDEETTTSISVVTSSIIDPVIEVETPKFSLIRVLIIFLIVGALVSAALLLRRILAVDSTDISASDINSTHEEIDVIQMPTAVSVMPTERIPPKSLLEVLAKGGSGKSPSPEGLASTAISQSESKATTSSTSSRTEAELEENVLQFDRSKLLIATSSVPDASGATAESPTIPFRIQNFTSAKPRSVATHEVAADATMERNPNSTPNSPPAPLAKALFQLERGRSS
jgi:hypothetical protein